MEDHASFKTTKADSSFLKRAFIFSCDGNHPLPQSFKHCSQGFKGTPGLWVLKIHDDVSSTLTGATRSSMKNFLMFKGEGPLWLKLSSLQCSADHKYNSPKPNRQMVPEVEVQIFPGSLAPYPLAQCQGPRQFCLARIIFL